MRNLQAFQGKKKDFLKKLVFTKGILKYSELFRFFLLEKKKSKKLRTD